MNDVWTTNSNPSRTKEGQIRSDISVNDTVLYLELIVAWEKLDEIQSHLLSNSEQTATFDLPWFKKNVF